MLVLDPNLGEEKLVALVTKFEEKIKSLGGEVERTDKWGVRKLASMMKAAPKLKQAYYAVIYFNAETSLPAKIRNTLKVTENIVRYNVARATKAQAAEIEGVPLEEGKEIPAVNVGDLKPAEEGTSGQS
jgi:small subunit ribosomal protein S6